MATPTQNINPRKLPLLSFGSYSKNKPKNIISFKPKLGFRFIPLAASS
jgi:hypothetical protein